MSDGSKPGMDSELAILAATAIDFGKAGVRIVGVHWKEYADSEIQVQSSEDLDLIVGHFGFSYGSLFGDVNHPLRYLTGVVNDHFIRVFGPAR